MSDIAIKVEGLGKRYELGELRSYETIRESLMRLGGRIARGLARPGSTKPKENFWALKDVSFEVKQGEVVGIIGRNGAGKSTLLKILSRITDPTEGRAELRGRVGSLLEVGTGFHPELTGRENIYLNGAILGMTRAEIKSKFDEIVAFSEIEKFLDTPVKRYSSGMYVRLAFAVAAHLEPEILIVDEVLAVGDAEFQKKCLGKMRDVAREGRTVVFISHDLTAVLRLTNRAVLLDAGRMSKDGPTPMVIDAYISHGGSGGNLVDLSGRQRSTSLRRLATIQSAKLVSSNPIAPWRLAFGSEVILEIEYEVHIPTDRLEMGIGLFTSTGFEIASTLSSHTLGFTSVPRSRLSMRVRYCEFTLTPGTYSFSIGLRSARGMEDHVPEAMFLEIATSQAATAASIDALLGAVIPKVEWESSQQPDLPGCTDNSK